MHQVQRIRLSDISLARRTRLNEVKLLASAAAAYSSISTPVLPLAAQSGTGLYQVSTVSLFVDSSLLA